MGTLLEDAETKTAALERVEEMEESLSTVRRAKLKRTLAGRGVRAAAATTAADGDKHLSTYTDDRASAGRGERSHAKDRRTGEAADANQQGAGSHSGESQQVSFWVSQWVSDLDIM